MLIVLLSLFGLGLANSWVVEFAGSPNENRQQIEEFAQKHNLVHQMHIVDNAHLFRTSRKRTNCEDLISLSCRFAKEKDPKCLDHLEKTKKKEGTSDPTENIKWVKQQHPISLQKRQLVLPHDKEIQLPSFLSSTTPKRSSKELPYKDPLLTKQWHLHNATEIDHVHVNVLKVWSMGITGKGAVVAVIDDGVQHTHPDLKPNWLPGPNNWNFNYDTPDVQPRDPQQDWHGTAVTGLAVAAADQVECGVGVSPDAKFSSIVLLQNSNERLNDAIIARAIAHRYDINDIFCNSWGPQDDGLRKEAPQELTSRTLLKAIHEGRNGKGSLYMWAAGNGRKNLDNCNYDGYANSRYVTTIGAITFTGTVTEYSEPCSALIGVLPSGEGWKGLQTTDMLSMDGQNKLPGSLGNCNTNFAGTSVASPLAAGIAALVLEANPNITWLDFQYILKYSAVKIDPNNPGWKLNGGGNWVSHDYGFGLIDAHEAVQIALRTTTNLKEISHFYHRMVNKTVNNQGFVSDTVFVDHSIVLHHVEVILTAVHSFRGHLGILLISPNGTVSIFAEKHRDPNPNYQDWRFVSLFSWGENSHGPWTLQIQDQDGNIDHNARFAEWTLKLYGIDNKSAFESVYVKKGIVAWDIPQEPPGMIWNSTYLNEGDPQLIKVILMGGFISTILLTVTIIVVVAMKNLPESAMVATREAFKELQTKFRDAYSSSPVPPENQSLAMDEVAHDPNHDISPNHREEQPSSTLIHLEDPTESEPDLVILPILRPNSRKQVISLEDAPSSSPPPSTNPLTSSSSTLSLSSSNFSFELPITAPSNSSSIDLTLTPEMFMNPRTTMLSPTLSVPNSPPHSPVSPRFNPTMMNGSSLLSSDSSVPSLHPFVFTTAAVSPPQPQQPQEIHQLFAVDSMGHSSPPFSPHQGM